MTQSTLRLMDANLNRVREGLRVCEDICRFVWEKEEWVTSFRQLRHQITHIALERMNLMHLIQNRDTETDIGRGMDTIERESVTVQDLFLKNLQRAKEGLRVLEEFGQQIDPVVRHAFQTLRYRLYQLEKTIVCQWNEDQQLSTLRHSG